MSESPAALKVALAGSARRGEATVGDLDVLVASRDRAQVAARFVTLPEISEVLLQGDGRCSVRLHGGLQADLRVLAPEEFGAGLHYFTGSKLHNIAMRLRGTRRGLKVNDHGVFRRSDEYRFLPGETEEDIFAAVGLPFIPPELRENLGEIEAAEEGRLPDLITESDIQGDLHLHTRDSDGSGTADEMIARAAMLPGHRYIAITDHSKSLRVANGLDEARLLAQMKRLRALEQSTGSVRVLCGIEVDILPNGQLDLDIEVLRQLDWVVASVHQHLDLDAEAMTRRVIRAMESGVVDCIGHPTGRRVGHRDPYAIDLEAVLSAARRIGVAVECNGGPNRMDLPDVACRQAREMGVPVVINTDAHSPAHLGRREFAIAMARRGWLERKHVLNAQPWAAIADRRSERMRRNGVRVLEDLEPAAALASDATKVEDEAEHAWTEPAEPAEPSMPVDLDRALAMRPLPAALRERLMRFLQQGDPELEAALARLSEHPMQHAFALLASPAE
jgi:DNA polymerase (family 10)